uniref:3'-5' exonuclease domain-containing protein n=1 Tax=Leersia perrieri TaxID=77586 RepID=A0A0D9V3R9_9ORYZ
MMRRHPSSASTQARTTCDSSTASKTHASVVPTMAVGLLPPLTHGEGSPPSTTSPEGDSHSRRSRCLGRLRPHTSPTTPDSLLASLPAITCSSTTSSNPPHPSCDCVVATHSSTSIALLTVPHSQPSAACDVPWCSLPKVRSARSCGSSSRPTSCHRPSLASTRAPHASCASLTASVTRTSTAPTIEAGSLSQLTCGDGSLSSTSSPEEGSCDRRHHEGESGLIVGIDTEWRECGRNDHGGKCYKVAVLQLCVIHCCLVFPLSWRENTPPPLPKLAEFLANLAVWFVGVGVDDDMKRLAKNCNLHVASVVDLGYVAAAVLARCSWSDGLLPMLLAIIVRHLNCLVGLRHLNCLPDHTSFLSACHVWHAKAPLAKGPQRGVSWILLPRRDASPSFFSFNPGTMHRIPPTWLDGLPPELLAIIVLHINCLCRPRFILSRLLWVARSGAPRQGPAAQVAVAPPHDPRHAAVLLQLPLGRLRCRHHMLLRNVVFSALPTLHDHVTATHIASAANITFM